MDQQGAAFVNAAVARALIRAMAMQAENMQRSHRGEAMAYDQKCFESLITEEGIGHDSIVAMLNGR